MDGSQIRTVSPFTCFSQRFVQPQLGERQRLGGPQLDATEPAGLPFPEGGGVVVARQGRRLVAAHAAAVDGNGVGGRGIGGGGARQGAGVGRENMISMSK